MHQPLLITAIKPVELLEANIQIKLLSLYDKQFNEGSANSSWTTVIYIVLVAKKILKHTF
jgi:hypothetical protein